MTPILLPSGGYPPAPPPTEVEPKIECQPAMTNHQIIVRFFPDLTFANCLMIMINVFPVDVFPSDGRAAVVRCRWLKSRTWCRGLGQRPSIQCDTICHASAPISSGCVHGREACVERQLSALVPKSTGRSFFFLSFLLTSDLFEWNSRHKYNAGCQVKSQLSSAVSLVIFWQLQTTPQLAAAFFVPHSASWNRSVPKKTKKIRPPPLLGTFPLFFFGVIHHLPLFVSKRTLWYYYSSSTFFCWKVMVECHPPAFPRRLLFIPISTFRPKRYAQE